MANGPVSNGDEATGKFDRYKGGKMKLCCECKWYEADAAYQCRHVSNVSGSEPDYVTGALPIVKYYWASAQFSRQDIVDGICGPDARHFEPIELA